MDLYLETEGKESVCDQLRSNNEALHRDLRHLRVLSEIEKRYLKVKE